jgi:hypothetical protein
MIRAGPLPQGGNRATIIVVAKRLSLSHDGLKVRGHFKARPQSSQPRFELVHARP